MNRYVEVPVDQETDVSYNQEGTLTAYMRVTLGESHPLTAIARELEDNLIQRDDVLIAMAARRGIYIPPVNYGNDRGYYTLPDGQYVVREYSRRLVDVASQCRKNLISSETVQAWLRATPQEVADEARKFNIAIPQDEIDEENEYYCDRLSFYLKMREASTV